MVLLLFCSECGSKFQILQREYKRQTKKGREHFFCSRTCSAIFNNRKRKVERRIKNKICPVCNKEFETIAGPKESTFCSRSCASKGSVTHYRRSKMREGGLAKVENLLSQEEVLSKREAWKYVKLKEKLNNARIHHKFEYGIDSFVFDLALFDKNLLIEFDEKYHQYSKQKNKDFIRDKKAESLGWKVIRLETEASKEIDPNILNDICFI